MKNFERTWVQVDLNAMEHNYGAIAKAFPNVQIMTVLKGDAYGHGIDGIVPVCERHTDAYAVATMEEGARIRKQGGKKPVLIFGPVPVAQMVQAASLGLTFTLGSLIYAKQLSSQLVSAGLTATCQIKLDTGLNRTGIRWREATCQTALEELFEIYQLPALSITGVYTHLACPESQDADDVAFTQRQFDRLTEACRQLEEKGYNPGLRHCCATGGAIAHPEFRLDMVRLGMMVHGQCDTLEHKKELGLKETLCWKSRIVQLEDTEAGEDISYSRTYRTDRKTVLGVVSCGYADGYRRCYQKFATALVKGQQVKILGRICMDYLLVDVTEIPDVKLGDEVVLLGTQGDQTISAITISEAVESVCGEVTGAISARVPRYYV